MPRFKHIEGRVAEKARIKQKKIKKRPLLGEGNTLWQRIRSAPHARGYTEFLFYCIFLFVLAFFVDQPATIFRGYLNIILSPSHLITDYVAVGGLGATFLNSASVTLLSLIFLYSRRVKISGPIIAALFTMSGFAFFGKNILNSVPIMMGSLIYSIVSQISFSQVAIISLFSTALGPMVSMLWLGVGLKPLIGIPLGILIGLLIGFISPPLAGSFLRFHRGYNLYNVGFTAGIIGMVFTALLRMFDVKMEPILLISTEHSLLLGIFIGLLSLLLIVTGLWRKRDAWKEYTTLLKQPGQLITDFTKHVSVETTLCNMGIMGLLSCGYIIALDGTINGPVIGGVLTVIGFAAFGVHPGNGLSVMLGVGLAAITNNVPYNDTSAIIAALFGTTLAP